MTGQFRSDVEEAYSRAASLPEEDRASFLEETYPTSPDLRREVESLLKYKPAADRVGQSTLLAAAAGMFNDDGSGMIGAVVAGKYVIRCCLGVSQMAEVYLANHMVLNEPFVLKRPTPALKGDRDFRRQLLDEGRHAVSLKHPNVARVHDIVESGEDVFLVMEFIEGQTLRARLQPPGRTLSADEFFPIAIQSASAPAAAHEKRIVHLDVKPENIMLTQAGQVKICDFGVARKLSAGSER